MNRELPTVSLIVPLRNEESFVHKTLTSLLGQDYPRNLLEILLVDGKSTDRTREVIHSALASHNPQAQSVAQPRVLVLDNPRIITSAALNIGLDQSRGDVIILVGGHCELKTDYVRRCVSTLEDTRADCVGGTIYTLGVGLIANAIAIAQSSTFGVGNSRFRIGGQRSGRADTVPFAAYRRTLFDRVGNFDEELIRNQDDEFNYRLIRAGGTIWFDPRITSFYYCRSSFRDLWTQYFQYGLYKIRVIQKHRALPSWRHVVPAMLVFGTAFGLASAMSLSRPRLLLLPIAPYLACSLVATLHSGWRHPSSLPFLPVAFATLHYSYGLGLCWGVWRWRHHFRRPTEVSSLRKADG
jgi:succinoglycan biosynthesis protein ExoA